MEREGAQTKACFVESWSALTKTRSSSRSHPSTRVVLLLNGSQGTSLQRAWARGGCRTQAWASVGHGPLICGTLLISTSRANDYVSELLLNQMEKCHNIEPMWSRGDLKRPVSFKRGIGRSLKYLSCFWTREMGTLENFALDRVIPAGEVQTQMSNLEIAAFQITGKAATFSLYNKENNSNEPRVASNYSKQDNWRL